MVGNTLFKIQKYILLGHNGHQTEKKKKFNEPLLNRSKIQHIYLYRVKRNNTKKEYMNVKYVLILG